MQNKQIRTKEFSLFHSPMFLGRSFFGWINLLLGIVNLIVVINTPLSYSSILSGFVIGLCFTYFLYDSVQVSLFKSLDESVELNVKMLRMLKQMDEYIHKLIKITSIERRLKKRNGKQI